MTLSVVKNQFHSHQQIDSADEALRLARLAQERRLRFFKLPPKPKPVIPPPRVVTFQELVAAAYPRRYPERDQVFKIQPSVAEIQRVVCQQFKVDLNEILSRRRHSTIVMPRQIAMALCKKLTRRSFPDIGRKFGGKDHTTVLHSWRKLEPAVMAAIDQVGLNASLSELVGMTAYYAEKMDLKVVYKKSRQQPSLPKINL